MTIDQQIESLIQVASRLIDLMNREVEMLRTMRPQELENLREEKSDLVVAYEAHYQGLASNREALVTVTPALMEEFAEVSKQFHLTLTENSRALTAARVAHERLMAAIVEAVNLNKADGQSYSANGESTVRREDSPMSLSLDCRL